MPDADWLRTAETILKRVTLERDDLALRVDAKAQKLAVLDEEIAHYRAVLDSYNRLQPRGLSPNTSSNSHRTGEASWWAVEPDVGRVAHGIPSRVDRLRALGNAVVPAQIYPILKAIAAIEGEK